MAYEGAYGQPITASAYGGVAVTPSAGALAGGRTRALYVGAAGSVTVTMASGDSITFAAVPAGTILPIQVTHVTTAAGGSVLALY